MSLSLAPPGSVEARLRLPDGWINQQEVDPKGDQRIWVKPTPADVPFTPTFISAVYQSTEPVGPDLLTSMMKSELLDDWAIEDLDVDADGLSALSRATYRFKELRLRSTSVARTLPPSSETSEPWLIVHSSVLTLADDEPMSKEAIGLIHSLSVRRKETATRPDDPHGDAPQP